MQTELELLHCLQVPLVRKSKIETCSRFKLISSAIKYSIVLFHFFFFSREPCIIRVNTVEKCLHFVFVRSGRWWQYLKAHIHYSCNPRHLYKMSKPVFILFCFEQLAYLLLLRSLAFWPMHITKSKRNECTELMAAQRCVPLKCVTLKGKLVLINIAFHGMVDFFFFRRMIIEN